MPTVKIAYLGDPHCPAHDPAALEWACGQIRDFKPDYTVLGGDLFEADAASRFENENEEDLLTEFECGADWVDDVAEAAGGGQLYWTLGNHDYNILSPGRIDSRVRRLCDWNNTRFSASFARWTQIPFDFGKRGVLQIGQVILWHGHDGSEELNALKIINATGGFSHRLVVGGHTHVPHGPTRIHRSKKVPLPFWYANGGTLGPLSPEWTRRQDTSQWAPGIVLIEAVAGSPCQSSRNWECVVRQME